MKVIITILYLPELNISIIIGTNVRCTTYLEYLSAENSERIKLKDGI